MRIKNLNSGSGLISASSAERKKYIIVACLVVVMLALWIKVFLNKQPSEVSAGTEDANANSELVETSSATTEDTRIEYLPLPFEQGRNNILLRDLFNVKQWSDLTENSLANDEVKLVKEQVVESDNIQDRKVIVDEAAKRIYLAMIISGQEHEAFVNDHIVKKDDQIKVKLNNEEFLFDVKEINDSSMVLNCEGYVTRLSIDKPEDY